MLCEKNFNNCSLRCKSCNIELPDEWDDEFCQDCYNEFSKYYMEDLVEMLQEENICQK